MILDNVLSFRLSGGALNSTPGLSLGGEVSNTPIVTLLENSDTTGPLEEYKCFYLLNTSASETIIKCRLFYSNLGEYRLPNVALALETSGINTTAQTIESKNTSPIGLTFTNAKYDAQALNIGDLPPLGYIAVWIRRIITPERGPHSGGVRLYARCRN